MFEFKKKSNVLLKIATDLTVAEKEIGPFILTQLSDKIFVHNSQDRLKNLPEPGKYSLIQDTRREPYSVF